ncbi:hypothetical protein FM115_09810 [Marinilactibacillus psychrotolerans 42ea]|uniref:C4-dicarboxylate ABC transporter n=1 Tax=Marinilactibacillus psychrotolerans 42ea TaxID=1255609 RepID=A0A1R4KFF1_9LACT|nr:C4-dicarboxylate transporter DcuC [Marinilactibacillus psychrotolerans]SJN43029.1 hypothetical protein FM115_09810 [Marinilactibacillus psychrotolerans 42ea]
MIVMYGSAIAAALLVVYMLLKKMDIKITLFATGIVLMFVAMSLGKGIAIEGFESTNFVLLDPLLALVEQFKLTLTNAGFIILVLGGYASYMTYIGANKVTVSALLKPIKKIKSVYILVPIVFIIGNLLSLVIPSASNLAIILLATLFPVLKATGMSTLTIGAIIATSATIVPTPLGGDNVAIATELASHPMFSGLTVSQYVFSYHALVSIPTLLIIAITHYFWQKYLDKKNPTLNGNDELAFEENIDEVEEIKGGKLFKFVYTLLPVLPILLLLVTFFLQSTVGITMSLSVEVVTIFSFIVAILCEMIRYKKIKPALSGTDNFFKGMGNSIDIVALLVAASVFVLGLQSIGLIDELQNIMISLESSGNGFILPLLLVVVTVGIVLISGSGTALFYAMVPLMVPLAAAAGINPIAVTVPMGLAGNLMRAVSPVAAVIMIVSGTIKQEPLDLVKRTSVPMIVGLIFMFILSMVLFV